VQANADVEDRREKRGELGSHINNKLGIEI